tara:strand:- start:429 stop:614 length:186 start_codon:yes stop_codon:yes gene_type:complete
MSLKTRLDGRSEGNESFELLDKEGNVLAKVSLLNSQSITLEIDTQDGNYIEKPSGWNSKPK